jgi:hypothetical protein
MMPMKVKKGMASRVSFCMMPNTRSGRAWNRLAPNRCHFHADEAEQQARGGQAEGHRDAGQQEEEQRREHQRHEVLR